jgi:hypothetical protein
MSCPTSQQPIMRKIHITDPKDWAEIAKRLLERSERIPESGCWIWSRAISREGYGRMFFRGRHLPTHRLSYMLFNGEISADTPFICHRCDIRCCINPHHLYQGTIYQNNQDAIARDRLVKGSKAGSSKLNEDQILQIKALLEMNLTKPEIARAYGIAISHVGNIKRGQYWGWLQLGDNHD